MTVRLRLATEADLPQMVELGRDMHATSSFAPMRFSPTKVEAHLRHGITGAGLVVLAEVDGAIAGGIHGDVVEPWYSDADRMGIEYFIYVRPEFRGGRSALMLLRAWVGWCAKEGVKQIRPATAATSPEADRLYRALGFTPAGALYVMNQEQFP